MNHVPSGCKSVLLSGVVMTACLVVGCGPGAADGSKAESISPEMQSKVDETIYKNYSSDYKNMYGKSKKGQ